MLEEDEESPLGGLDDVADVEAEDADEDALLKEVCRGICFGPEGGSGGSEFCCCSCGEVEELEVGEGLVAAGLALSARRRVACTAICGLEVK